MKHLKNVNNEKNQNIVIGPVPYRVIEAYMHEVRDMHKERLEKIKAFADSISKVIESSPKKRVNGLINAKSVEEFRNQLRLVMADAQKSGNKEPLIGFDDFTMVLIPGDYRGWTEIRDLIIIRIYENLHDVLVADDESEDIS
jgi:CRISPR-associated protein Cst1